MLIGSQGSLWARARLTCGMNCNDTKRQPFEHHVVETKDLQLRRQFLGSRELADSLKQILVGRCIPPVASHPRTGMQIDIYARYIRCITAQGMLEASRTISQPPGLRTRNASCSARRRLQILRPREIEYASILSLATDGIFFGIKLLQRHRTRVFPQTLLSNGKNFRTYVRGHDSSLFDRRTPHNPNNYVTGPRCSIKEHAPVLACNSLRNTPLPYSMCAKAEGIAKSVVARGNTTEYIVALPSELGRIFLGG